MQRVVRLRPHILPTTPKQSLSTARIARQASYWKLSPLVMLTWTQRIPPGLETSLQLHSSLRSKFTFFPLFCTKSDPYTSLTILLASFPLSFHFHHRHFSLVNYLHIKFCLVICFIKNTRNIPILFSLEFHEKFLEVLRSIFNLAQ